MGERKVGKSEAIIEATGNLVSKVRDRWSLAALAIAGIVGLFYGARTDDSLGSICLALGLCAIVVIVWRLTRPSPSPTESELSAIGAPQVPDWTQGGRDEHGFFIEEGRLEVRYFDWGEKHHREIYEKYLKVIPIRNCDLKIDAWGGASSPKNMEFYHTPRFREAAGRRLPHQSEGHDHRCDGSYTDRAIGEEHALRHPERERGDTH